MRRRIVSLTCLILAGLVTALAVASLFVGVGWGLTCSLAVGRVIVCTFTPGERFGSWLIDMPWPHRLRELAILPYVSPRWSELPCWVVVVPLLLLAWLIWPRRVKRPGCCSRCGYDLRGTPQCCPECGTAVRTT